MSIWAHAALVAAVGAFALLKEREELACGGWTPGGRRQCVDEESVYVRGTAPAADDDHRTAKAKLVSILSYHEKGGVWKRCFLLAAVLAYLAHTIARATACCADSAGWTLAMQHLVFFAVLYFYFNFLNYHHFRVLKRHGQALLRGLPDA